MNKKIVPILLTVSIVLNVLLLFFLFRNFETYSFFNPSSINNIKTSNKISVFSASNLEWLNLYSKLTKGSLNEFITTWKSEGIVDQISDQPGEKSGFKDYYTGQKKGFFHYAGKLSLIYKNNRKIEWALSDRRMKLLKVYKMSPSGPVEQSFQDIKRGDRVEIEESVDLTVSNINDENVRYLIIRIF